MNAILSKLILTFVVRLLYRELLQVILNPYWHPAVLSTSRPTTPTALFVLNIKWYRRDNVTNKKKNSLFFSSFMVVVRVHRSCATLSPVLSRGIRCRCRCRNPSSKVVHYQCPLTVRISFEHDLTSFIE